MLKTLYKNKFYYSVLYLGLAGGLLIFFAIPKIRVETIVGLCVFYFMWGVAHHVLENNLHYKIVLEYLLISAIACLLLLTLMWRA